MEEYKFVIAIQNKIPILVSGPPNIVTDNTDYMLELVTDAEWDGFEAKTVFYGTDAGVNMVHSITGNSDTIPMQIKAGALYIGISAGELHTTRDVRIPVVPSVRRRSGMQIPDPTPDVYDQIMGTLNTHENRITHLEQYGGGGSGYVPPMVGATASADGAAGLVPIPLAGQQDAVLHGDGTWRKVSASGGGSVSAEIADGGMFLTTTMSVTIAGGGMMIA